VQGIVPWLGDDPDIPDVPPPPTFLEDLLLKPSAQREFQQLYFKILASPVDSLFVSEAAYRRTYLGFHKLADAQLQRALAGLEALGLTNDTIVIYTSDHGEMLGSHGGQRQKWHQFYEETARVPWTVSNPVIFPAKVAGHGRVVQSLSSAIDLLPTMLGMAGANISEVSSKLQDTHSEFHPLPGRDWTRELVSFTSHQSATQTPFPHVLVGSAASEQTSTEAVYFETSDTVSFGGSQIKPICKMFSWLHVILGFFKLHCEYDALQVVCCFPSGRCYLPNLVRLPARFKL
jgi:arylsulfatase A-like enzyme